MRESMVFYKSFYESIKELDPKDQVQIYNAIFEYEFYKIKPELTGICKSIFTLILPQLEANDKRYENGKKGGRPKTKEKPKRNQKETKVEPNVNDNVNVNVNDNVNVINNSSSSYKNNIYEFVEQNFGRIITPTEIDKIEKWLKEFNVDIIKYAIQIAVLNNKKTFNYVNGILNNWKSKGYKTLQEIKDNDFKKENITKEAPGIYDYDWLNEEE
jgi:DnaD/phage-associated family protein